MEYWAQEMEKRTNGRVKVQFFWGGALGPGGAQVDGIKAGTFDLAIVCPAFHPGKTPLTNVLTIPGISSDHIATIKAFVDLAELPEIKAELGKWNAKYLFSTGNGNYEIMSNVPIRTLADIKGTKLRAIGYQAELVKALQGVPVAMPAADIYMALSKGTVAGAVWAGAMELESYGFHEVIKYYTITDGFCTGSLGYHVISKDAWNKLTKEEQKISNEIAAEIPKKYVRWLQDGIGRSWYIMQRAGVQLFVFTKADTKVMLELAMPLRNKWAKEQDARGLAGTKVKNFFLERVRYWETHK
jgi:TRAP-type C4-dicarboxylate transport system substrate-binding protein